MSNKNKASGATAANGSPSRRDQLRQRQEQEARRARMMRIVGVAAGLLALVLVAVVGTVLYQNNKHKTEALSASGTPTHANADNSGIVVNPGKAKAGAPVLQVYQDYQCPLCKQAEQQLTPLIQPLADQGDVVLEYRTMTFMDSKLANDSSSRAAIAAACADTAGKYKAYHDEVFANQPQKEVRGSDAYPEALLRETIPQKVGITGEALSTFQSCYDTKATEDFVTGTNDKAGAAGVDGTPRYRVNGKDLDMASIGTTPQSMLEAIRRTAAG